MGDAIACECSVDIGDAASVSAGCEDAVEVVVGGKETAERGVARDLEVAQLG
jgi:hypothetical protein